MCLLVSLDNDRAGVTSSPELDVALFGLNLLIPLMTTELLKVPSYLTFLYILQIS